MREGRAESMRYAKTAAVLLITALLLTLIGCGEETQLESTAPDNSALLLSIQQYQSSMESFQDNCIKQIRAFTDSLRNGDVEAGQAAADALAKSLESFESISAPDSCRESRPCFVTAKKKTNTAYALMIQILGDGQYTNDDMANLTALKAAAEVIAESYQSGFKLLEKTLDELK